MKKRKKRSRAYMYGTCYTTSGFLGHLSLRPSPSLWPAMCECECVLCVCDLCSFCHYNMNEWDE